MGNNVLAPVSGTIFKPGWITATDLRSIRDYTLETWGPEQEELEPNKLWSRIEFIRSEPSCCRLRDELFPGCRIASEGRHVLLFRVVEDSLEIVRVFHSAMDFKCQLSPEDV